MPNFVLALQICTKGQCVNPPDKVVLKALRKHGFSSITKLRMGRYVEIPFDAPDLETAKQQAPEIVEAAALVNPVMEDIKSLAVTEAPQPTK